MAENRDHGACGFDLYGQFISRDPGATWLQKAFPLMKRLLLISYSYPPRRDVGSVRPGGLTKYLPHFGWESIVLTPAMPSRRPSGTRVIETDCQDVLGRWKVRFGLDPAQGLHEQLKLRQSSSPASHLLHSKLIYWAKSWLSYPDHSKAWLPLAQAAIRSFAQREDVDIVLSTSPPITCHLLGMYARKILRRPWVADCRDMWIPAREGSRLLRRRLRSLERRTLAKADALVTVSAPWAEHLRQGYPAKPVHAITNGFDPEDFVGEAENLTKSFSITYTGNLYLGWRDPQPVIRDARGTAGGQFASEEPGATAVFLSTGPVVTCCHRTLRSARSGRDSWLGSARSVPSASKNVPDTSPSEPQCPHLCGRYSGEAI